MEIPSPDDLKARKEKRDGGVGPIVGIVIIVLLLIAGGIYFLVTQEIERQNTPPAGQEQALLR
jgi:hypothetical protein